LPRWASLVHLHYAGAGLGAGERTIDQSNALRRSIVRAEPGPGVLLASKTPAVFAAV